MQRHPIPLAAWFCACAVTACGESSPGGGPDLDCDFDPAGFEAFDAAISSFLSAHGLAGASAAVVHERCGSVHVQGYGAYAPDRSYLLASASKVTSVGVLMQLADRGLLDFDAPIGEYMEAAGGKPELTLAMLVSNSSGLVGLVDNPFYRPYRCQYQTSGSLSECAESIYTADDAADRQPPDTSFHYGGGQWQLAGGIAERVSGLSWNDLVRATYAPCRLRSFGYGNPFARGSEGEGLRGIFDYPASFRGDPANLAPTENPSVEGGAFGSVEDYAGVLLMHLRGGRCDDGTALSRAAVARMQVDRILEIYGGSTAGQAGRTAAGDIGAFEGYGLGWWIDRRHPGVFADPGLYGTFPWLDVPRGYGAVIALEADGTLGAQLWATVKPGLDQLFDTARR